MADQQHEEKRQTAVSPKGGGSVITRRGFLKGAGAGAVTVAVAPAVLMGQPKPVMAQETTTGVSSATIKLNINGKSHTVDVEARTTLATALRDHLEITGAKVVCDRGECGACTVMMDGRLVFSCMTLAMDAQGKVIETVESLSNGDKLHPVQEAFIEKDALMCGFCTPGFVLAVKALLDKNPNPTLDDVKRGVSGNICRCGTYPRVFEAALAAAQTMRNGG